MKRVTIGRTGARRMSFHLQWNLDEYDDVQILISGGWSRTGREIFIQSLRGEAFFRIDPLCGFAVHRLRGP
jgi:hypothetical protein